MEHLSNPDNSAFDNENVYKLFEIRSIYDLPCSFSLQKGENEFVLVTARIFMMASTEVFSAAEYGFNFYEYSVLLSHCFARRF